ncbi:MAG: hypothetical protein MPI95_07090 [Nitrosopumilus sp.]|nr:hypothetical protein [Nitrosopumilus sp.]CAI9830659.1 conserved hypothetical protein [Nitrosopumilaceae archaeon]MDA7941137.1 hypothetical protein [Nitrosopumilus sp.]MDA7942465.1 hypothetical protein [Nitrosopumilus sp.]MDA7945513.1 hypothetical protein [Nitrosopumilus sp.]
MARVRVRVGEAEVEVDSRDFYVDNETVAGVVAGLSASLPASAPVQPGALDGLEEAEAFEPEFSEPQRIAAADIRSKLRVLETSSFFSTPHTVSETVEQLREYGWAASPLDVSKELARMASNREVSRGRSGPHASYVTC